ncbi:MAG: nitronate monooxygenase [Deltaproteobacteria bacterium]|nr:nitronate monooxygenase [Deltaproteobacteria bacterium]
MLKTRVTELLGVEYPVQCGTMQGLSQPVLVAAVANAGGFACLPAATFPGEGELQDAIKETKDMTDKPFGVNVSLFPALMPKPGDELIDLVIQSGVKILETAGRSPAPYRDQIKDAGLVHIHKCARVRDAIKVDGLGVDIVSIVGTECGGHPSMEGVTSLVLIPQAAENIKAPLIAGGGFSDGRTLIVALALGAEAVNMGTRFMATRECPVHQAVKDKMVEAPENATTIVMQSLMNPMRAYRNSTAEQVLELESKGAGIEELAPVISGEQGRTGWQQGNLDQGLMPVGQVMGRLKDIPTVADLFKRIIDEAVETQGKINSVM